MKCQNCGKNKATYHYRANINGQKSEQHLCAECAEKLQNGEDDFFGGMDSMFNDFFGGFFERPSWGFAPAFGRLMMPAMVLPRLEFSVRSDEDAAPEAEKPEAKCAAAPADAELSKRREINALREQMNAAVKAEEFEKAAELRDKLRELEK